jgi:hypothetical protein
VTKKKVTPAGVAVNGRRAAKPAQKSEPAAPKTRSNAERPLKAVRGEDACHDDEIDEDLAFSERVAARMVGALQRSIEDVREFSDRARRRANEATVRGDESRASSERNRAERYAAVLGEGDASFHGDAHRLVVAIVRGLLGASPKQVHALADAQRDHLKQEWVEICAGPLGVGTLSSLRDIAEKERSQRLASDVPEAAREEAKRMRREWDDRDAAMRHELERVIAGALPRILDAIDSRALKLEPEKVIKALREFESSGGGSVASFAADLACECEAFDYTDRAKARRAFGHYVPDEKKKIANRDRHRSR